MSIQPTPEELALAAVRRAPEHRNAARRELWETQCLLEREGYPDTAATYAQAQAVLDDYYRS